MDEEMEDSQDEKSMIKSFSTAQIAVNFLQTLILHQK
jgi:hypothetical protein